jgi:hypothetical protein
MSREQMARIFSIEAASSKNSSSQYVPLLMGEHHFFLEIKRCPVRKKAMLNVCESNT